MRLSRYLLLVCLLCPAFAYGQGFQIRDVAQKLVNGNYQPAIGASVTVCTSAGVGIPCTPTTTIYTDIGLTSPSANPIIVGTSSNSDSLGNFYFYVSPNTSYVVTITGAGFTGRSLTYQLACPTSVSCAFTNAGTFTNTQMNQYLSSNINGINFATEFNAAQGGQFTTDAIASGIAMPVGATVHQGNAFAGYATTLCNSSSRTVCNTTPVYGQMRTLGNGSAGWGSNFLVQDLVGVTNHHMIIQELDSNIFGTPIFYRGLSMILGGNGTMPADSIGFELVNTNVAMKLNKAFWSRRGVAATGFELDGLNNTASSVSQRIAFDGYDAGNIQRQASIQADLSGNLQLQPAIGGSSFLLNSGGGLQMPGATSGNSTLVPPATGGVSNTLPSAAGTLLARTSAIDLTAQGASIGSTLAYSVTVAGQYIVSIYGVVSQAATTSSTLPTACVLWTDADSNGATQQIFSVTASGLTNTSNTTSTFESGTITVNPKISTTINYAFGNACTGGSAYASVGGTPMQFAARVRVSGI